MKSILVFLSFIFIGYLSFAQQSVKLTGQIKDKRGDLLPGSGIYVSGYKIATVSDNDGNYSLVLKPGNYDILVQLIGFKALNKNIVIADKSIQLDFILEESVTQLAEVTIKPDPNREHYLNLFKQFFVGTTPNALQCKILNPDILKIDYDKEERKLTVKTDEFLIIENQALGYRIKYLINLFEWDSQTRVIYYEGYPYYEDLKGSERKKNIWEKKRLIGYLGSPQHFFKSLYNGKATEEGFIIHKLISKPNPERLSDSLINAKVKKFTAEQLNLNGRIVISGQNHGDSLSYWIRKKNLPAGMSILNRAVVLKDTLVHSFNKIIKSINFTDQLYVIYTKEKEDNSFSNSSGLSISRALDMPDYQISTVSLQIAPAYFYENGAIYNPRSMLYSGYWAWEKIADSVPMDYIPTAAR